MSAVVHQFKIGNLDTLIVMNSGYSKRPARFGVNTGFKKVRVDFIINFELP
jgi:hypothetical protein